MQEQAQWETELWNELNALPPDAQIVVSGQVISHITHDLLTRLSDFRCDAAQRAVEEPGMDAGRVADKVGSRRSVIERLAARSRANKRAAVIASTEG